MKGARESVALIGCAGHPPGGLAGFVGDGGRLRIFSTWVPWARMALWRRVAGDVECWL